MIFVSPFTPLFFQPSTDVFGADSHYCQLFAPTDIIVIEVIGVENTDSVSLSLVNARTRASSALSVETWVMNESYTLYYCSLTGLAEGMYYVTMNNLVSETFCVTTDAFQLSRTTLIEYSMRDNRQRQDGVFVINGTQQYFQWRAPGGFKDDGWQFGVDNEQFDTLDTQVAEVFSGDIVQKQFTLGNAEGCPVWYAALLNRIMSCSFVIIGGDRYVRAGTATPEQTQSIVGRKSFIYKQLMRKVDYYDDDMVVRIAEGDIRTALLNVRVV
ncbi:MAG: hypothetical protein Q4D30_01335 [Bacteroidales bacterium]|nr:hypothetical protein [Bacteroidales bacterium]